jgi:DNA-binding transcriptional regulator GbsR (MarR family)
MNKNKNSIRKAISDRFHQREGHRSSNIREEPIAKKFFAPGTRKETLKILPESFLCLFRLFQQHKKKRSMQKNAF